MAYTEKQKAELTARAKGYSNGSAATRDARARAGYDPRYDTKKPSAIPTQPGTLPSTGPAEPTKPSEQQPVAIQCKTLLSGSDCEVHVRSYKGADGSTTPDALVVCGPTDANIQILADGTIVIKSGKHTEERGPGSGALNINAHGGIHTYSGPVFQNYIGDPKSEDKTGLGQVVYGDSAEDITGTKWITAEKIVLNASEIFLNATAEVNVQAGMKGTSGSIKMVAGRFEQNFVNEDKLLVGQKTQTGAGEDTSITYDPRSTTTVTSAGTLQHRVTGDYKIVVAGVMATSVYGASPTGMTGVPLITDRTHGYSLDVLVGKTKIISRVGSIDISSLGLGKNDKFDPKSLLDLPVGSVNISGLKVGVASTVGGVSISAGAKLTAIIPTGLIMTSKDVISAAATGLFTATTAGKMNLIAVDEMLVKSTGNVKIQGALIYLN